MARAYYYHQVIIRKNALEHAPKQQNSLAKEPSSDLAGCDCPHASPDADSLYNSENGC